MKSHQHSTLVRSLARGLKLQVALSVLHGILWLLAHFSRKVGKCTVEQQVATRQRPNHNPARRALSQALGLSPPVPSCYSLYVVRRRAVRLKAWPCSNISSAPRLAFPLQLRVPHQMAQESFINCREIRILVHSLHLVGMPPAKARPC